MTDTESLARRFAERVRRSELQLVIATDRIPRGLSELVAAVVGQNVLGDYQFRVHEIVPYIDATHSRVLFVPASRIETEIIQRIAVAVTTEEGEATRVQVNVSPLEEVEARTNAALSRASANTWTEGSFFAASAALPEATRLGLRAIYDHCAAHGYDLRFGRGAKIGTISVRCRGIELAQLMTDGGVLLFFVAVPPADAEVARGRLLRLGIDVPVGTYRHLKPAVWLDNTAEILTTLDELRVRIAATRDPL